MSDPNNSSDQKQHNLVSKLRHLLVNKLVLRKGGWSGMRRNPQPQRLGLALGCGGAKSLAHIGVLKALEEHQIPIHAVAGCSMGAYIGALWATGHSIDEMLALAAEMVDEDSLKRMADPIIPPIKGVFYGNKVKEHLRKSIGDVQFEDLDRPLYVVAANLNNYERVVFRTGSVLDAVHASCAMPGIIMPVEIDGKRCVDGGVADPVPVGTLRKFGNVNHIIAVSTTPSLEEIDTDEEATATAEREDHVNTSWWQTQKSYWNQKLNPAAPGNMLDNLSRSLTISQIRLADHSCRQADIAIKPISRGSEWHEYSKFEQFIEHGEKTTLEQIEDIKALLKTISPIHHESIQESLVGDRIA